MDVEFPRVQGEVHVKGAHLHEADTWALKAASGFPRNAAKGLAVGSGLSIVLSAQTGYPRAVLRADHGGRPVRPRRAGRRRCRSRGAPGERGGAVTLPLEPLRIERRTTSSRVAEALRDELLNGAWPPGTPVRDAALAEHTGGSRPTAREAIAELVHDGC